MKLNTLNRQLPVAQSLNHAVLASSEDFQLRWERCFFYDERVISRRGERRWQARKHAATIVRYL